MRWVSLGDRSQWLLAPPRAQTWGNRENPVSSDPRLSIPSDPLGCLFLPLLPTLAKQ